MTQTTDLYAILGVKRDATTEQIKAAYKKLAQIHHPDKQGGDEEKFKPIARAYKVLKDPELRDQYDRTGDPDQQKPLEEIVQREMLNLISQCLQQNPEQPIIPFLNKRIENGRKQIEQDRRQLELRKEQLLKKRPTVRSKGLTNIVHMIIDQELQQIEAGLEHLKKGVEINEAAAEMMKQYEEDVPPAEDPMDMFTRHMAQKHRGIYFVKP